MLGSGPRLVRYNPATMTRSPTPWTLRLGLSVLGALAVWLTIGALSPGYVADIESRKDRAKWVTEEGVQDAYRKRIDYPPGNLYLFAIVGHAYQSLVDPSFDHRRASASQLLTFLIKLPPTLFHLATGVLVYLVARRHAGERLAWLAATVLMFDPAAIFDVAHQGQYDPVHTFFSLAAVAGLAAGRPAFGGAAIGFAALTKPQSWILLPLVAAVAFQKSGRAGLVRSGLGGLAALGLGLLPFIVNNRLSHLLRLSDYMNTNSTANHVISANAHNLWWIPTLVAGRWIDDWEQLGPMSYRAAGVALVLLVLAACLLRLLVLRPGPDLYLLAAALGSGWFFFTPRAHEYHAFFVLPFLAIAWPSHPRLFGLYALASASLLVNLALHDPLIVGQLASVPDPANPFPAWYSALTLLNVVSFAALLIGVAVLLRPQRELGEVPLAAPAG
jgi:hypothetical protein